MSEQKEDLVIRPSHYVKYNIEFESIDLVDLFHFNLGCLIKYAIRYRDKGNPVMDLEKALYYAYRIEKNKRKREYALNELDYYKTIVQIYCEKSWDAQMKQTLSVLLKSLEDWNFLQIINLLEERLEEVKANSSKEKTE